MSYLVDSIPVIDVKCLSQKEEDLQQLAAQLKDAFTKIGFVALTNHNIPTDVVKNVWNSVGKFLDLPENEKSKYREDMAKKMCGWSPLGGQVLYNLGADVPTAADYREALNIDHRTFHWPSEIPDLEEATMVVIKELSSLGKFILRLMAIALNLKDTEYFCKCRNVLCDRNPTSIRFAQYPPIPEDVKGLSQQEEDLQKLAAQLKDAFTNIGFVAITNHNISLDAVNNAWESVKKFDELPIEVKSRYREDTKKKKFGWSPLGASVLYNPGAEIPSAKDWREALSIDPSKFEWPSELPELKETTMAFNQQMSALGQYVLKLMAVALDLQDREYFTRRHNMCSEKNPGSICFAQYPPIPKGGLVKGQMRCGEHTDFGSITLLIQDEEGGLEVQRRDGSWIETRPPYGTVMVNIGDMMQRWTSDKFISTNHRVREPVEERLKQRTRRSLIYFLDADEDTMVSCLDGSNKYPPISTFDYLWQRMQQHYD